MDLCSIQEVKALLGRHGFRFSKSMGQNFLIEDWVPRRIAEECGAGPLLRRAGDRSGPSGV